MKKRGKKGRGDRFVFLFILFGLFIGFGVFFVKYHLRPKPPPPSPLPILPAPTVSLPRVAIIIDDFGYSLSPHVKELLELDHPITVAILPKRHYTTEIGILAELAEKEVILHLPMEPHGYPGKGKDPGPGAIFCNLSQEEIRKRVREYLEGLPQAVGLNNHMGSKATENRQVMSTVLDKAKRRGLYFVDSLTSSRSVAFKLAREKGIRSASRDIFLDNKDDPVYISNQFDKLILKAKEEGRAIGIGHVYFKSTLEVLKERLPQLKEEGVELVFASEIVE